MPHTTIRSGLVLFALALAFVPASRAQPLGLPPDLSRDAEARGFADLLYANGMVQLAAGAAAGALPLFERAAATRPEDATYGYFAAICRLRLARYDEAIAGLTAALPPARNRVGEARIRYDLGTAHYLAGDHAAAERELGRAAALNDSDAWTHYYLGLTLFDRDHAAAFGEFERAVALDPALEADTAYYRAIAAYERGDSTTARRRFEQAAATSNPATVASSRQWLEGLAAAAPAARPPRGEIRVALAVEHDDNPGQINDDVVVGGAEKDERGVLQLRAAYHPWIGPHGPTVGLVLASYASRHQDFEAADLDGVQVVVQAAWGADPLGRFNGPLGYARVPEGEQRLGFLLQAGSSYFALHGESFKRDHELAASLLIGERGFGTTEVELAYDDATYFNGPFSLYDGHSTMLRVGQYFRLGARPERYLRVAAGGTAHSADEAGLERDTREILAELAWPVVRRVTLFLSAAHTRDDYADESQALFSIPESREDRRTDLAATAVIAVLEHGYATLRYGWTEKEVDPIALDILSYDRRIASAGFTWHW